jgi:hypothetical protein
MSSTIIPSIAFSKRPEATAGLAVIVHRGGPLIDPSPYHENWFTLSHNATTYANYSKSYIETSGGIFVAMILVPTLLHYLLRWCTRHSRRPNKWGRVKRVKGYMKRWLVERHLMDQLEPRWKDSKDIVSYMLHWRYHDTRDYAWWFWDPDQKQAAIQADLKDNSFLRYLPGWMRRGRSVLQEGAGRSNNDGCDLEQGVERPSRYLLPTRNPVNVSPNSNYLGNFHFEPTLNPPPQCRTTTSYSLNGALMNGRDPEDITTVRRRIVSHGIEPVWSSGSEQIHRAVRKQLLESTYEGQQVPPTLAHLFLPPPSLNVPSAKSGKIPVLTIRRTQSMPEMSNTADEKDGEQKTRTGRKQSAEQQVVLEKYAPHGFYPPKSQTAFMKGSPLIYSKSLPDIRGKLQQEASNAASADLAPGLVYDTMDRTPSVSTKRSSDPESILESVLGVPNKQSQKELRPQYIPRLPSYLLDDLSAYEANDSLDEAISDTESDTSTRERMLRLSRYRKHWYNPSPIVGSVKRRSKAIVDKLNGRTRSGRLASTHITPQVLTSCEDVESNLLPRKRKRRSAIDRGIHVSFNQESSSSKPEDDQDDDPIAPYQEIASISSTSLPLEPHHEKLKPLPYPSKASHPGSPATPQPPLSPPELQSRLSRLQYELSPGFRMPGSSLGHIFPQMAPTFSPTIQNPAPPFRVRAYSTPSRKQYTTRPGPPALHSLAPAQAVTTGENRQSLPEQGREEELKAEEKYNTHWILKQPPRPDGSWGEDGTLYAGGFGIRRTLVQWGSGAANVGPRRLSEGDWTARTEGGVGKRREGQKGKGVLGRTRSENVRVKKDLLNSEFGGFGDPGIIWKGRRVRGSLEDRAFFG